MKGIVVGAAMGGAVYIMAHSTSSQKRRLKRSADKALKSLGNMAESISDMM